MAFAEKYINPFTDFGFKKLFGSEPNKALLIDFLNQVVLPEQHRITELSYTRNEHLGATELDRKAIFDLYCIGKNGERFIVEMQKANRNGEPSNYFKDRSVFYASFPIQEQAKRGEWDFQLTEIYTVGVLDFVFSEDADEKEVRHEVKLKDQNGRVFYKKLTFVYLEMPHFTKTEEELETTYDKWLYVLKHLPYLDSKPKALQEKVFDQLFAVAEIAKFTPDEMNAYEQSLKYYRDLKNVIDTAIMEGETKGRLEGEMKGRIEGEMKGRIEGRIEGIQEGIREGEMKGRMAVITESITKALGRAKLTVEEIAEDFGVSVEFVIQIKNELGLLRCTPMFRRELSLNCVSKEN